MKKIFLILFFTLFYSTGCKKGILDIQPDGQQTVDELFANSDGAIEAMNAAYQRLCLLSSTQHSILHRVEEKSDNAFHARVNLEWKTYSETSTTLGIEDNWTAFYSCIQRCNTILNRLSQVNFTDSEKTSQLPQSLEGQALFLRGLCYFWLVQLWGDVPLYTKELSKPDLETQGRAGTRQVYDQIINDLQGASGKLPLKVNLTGKKGFEKFRASQGAAFSLLSEVYLVLHDWQKAADNAKAAIDTHDYKLYAKEDYIKNFQGKDENGQESVFEIQFTDNILGSGSIENTWYGLSGLVQGNGRYGSPSTDDNQTLTGLPGIRGDGLVQAFEANDIRKNIAISTYNNAKNPLDASKPSLWLCNKYFVGTTTPPENRSYVNIPLIRYAKVLLTRAEALNELGPANAEAVDLIHQIRQRAGLPDLSTSTVNDQDSFRKAIWRERRVELCFESQRYFDLLRTGTLIDQLQNKQGIKIPAQRLVKHPVTGVDIYLLPIPQNEINNNSAITQNKGY